MTLMRFDPFRELDRLTGLSADARDGVLTLTIPVTEASKPRRVQLSSADTSFGVRH